MIRLKTCKICGSKALSVVKKYTIEGNLSEEWKYFAGSGLMESQKVGIDLMVCLECGFIFYRDHLDPQAIQDLYSEEKRFEHAETNSGKKGRQWELKKMEDFLGQWSGIKRIKRVIDVGAGDFAALEKVASLIPGAEFDAIDPSYHEHTYKNVTVFQTMLEDFQPKEKYDLVLAIHILEHIADLSAFMKKIQNLHPSYLYAEVPFQVGPGLFLNRSINPQHINYFTPTSLRNLLEKYHFAVISMDFSRDGYRHNGMPGMIRVIAQATVSSLPLKKGLGESLFHLFNPLLFLKSRFLS